MNKLLKQYIIRIFVIGCFLLHLGALQAQNVSYYVSSQNGDDAHDGLSPATAWKTTDEVRKHLSALVPGSSVWFERGGIYYGTLNLTSIRGAADNPITFGAYGEGELPVISGAKQVTDWEKIDENLWRAYVPEHPGSIDVLFINGRKFYPARFPKTGFLTVTDYYSRGLHNRRSNFPDGYWNGATVAYKIWKWDILRETVTYSYNDGRIDLANASYIPRAPGWGYFFQNHIHAIDTVGDWVYDKNDHTVTLCTSENPNEQRIEFMYHDYAFSMEYSYASPERYNPCYFVFENLDFQHHRKHAIYGRYGRNLTVRNNIFRNSMFALYFQCFEYCDILENSIHDIEVNGIEICNVSHSRIHQNNIRRIGVSLDSDKEPSYSYSCVGIRANVWLEISNNFNEITLNRIDSTGYTGISAVWAENTLIKNNVVSNTMLCLGDGGGIYLTRLRSDRQPRLGNKITDNIVYNTIGNDEGTPGAGRNTHFQDTNGIYLDDGTGYVEVEGNTVFNSGWGMFFHNSGNNYVRHNVFYNNVISNIAVYDQASLYPYTFSKNDIQYNYMYGMNIPNPAQAWPNTRIANITYWMLFDDVNYRNSLTSNMLDHNYISAPFDSRYAMLQNIFNDRTGWSDRTDLDLHSRAEPVPYAVSGAESPEEFAILAYNPTARDTVILLDHTYISFDSIVYTGSIHLQPFKSAILFRYGNIGEPMDAPVGKTDICIGATAEYHVPESLDLSEVSAITWQISPPAAGEVISVSGTKGSVVTVEWAPNYQPSPVQLIYCVLMNDSTIRVSEALTVNLDQANGRPPAPEFTELPVPVFTADNPDGAEIEWDIPRNVGTLLPYNDHGNTVTVEWAQNLVGIYPIDYRLRNSCGEWGAESFPLYYSIPAAIPEGDPVLCEEVRSCFTAPPYSDMKSDFTWALEPENAGYLESNGNEACVTLNKNAANREVVLFYKGFNNYNYPIQSPTLTLTMNPLPPTPPQPSGQTAISWDAPSTAYTAEANRGEYEWQILPATAGTVSADDNRATVNWAGGSDHDYAGQVFISYRVKSNDNVCGFSDYSPMLTVSLLPKPPETDTSNPCAGSSSTFTTKSYIGVSGYRWSVAPSNAGTITSQTNTATISWSPFFSGQANVSYSVTDVSGRTYTSQVTQVNVRPLPETPPQANGREEMIPDGATFDEYTAVTEMNDYSWEIQPPEACTDMQKNDHRLLVAWSTNYADEADISYKTQNDCGWSPVSSPALTVTLLPAAPEMEQYKACAGAESIINAPLYHNAISYQWTITPSDAGQIVADGYRAVIYWSSAYTGEASISYTVVNSAQKSYTSPQVSVLVRDVPPKPPIASGANTVFLNRPIEIYLAVPQGIQYEWTVTPSQVAEIQNPEQGMTSILWKTVGEAAVAYRVMNECGWSEISDPLAVRIYKSDLFDDIPEIFTPNGDGFNDTWDIPTIQIYPEAMIRIYNRAKKLMAEFKGAQMPWDGRDRYGNLLESGYYFYQIELRKGGKVISGYVTILR